MIIIQLEIYNCSNIQNADTIILKYYECQYYKIPTELSSFVRNLKL